MVSLVVSAVALILTAPVASGSVLPVAAQQAQPVPSAAMAKADAIRLIRSRLGEELVERWEEASATHIPGVAC